MLAGRQRAVRCAHCTATCCPPPVAQAPVSRMCPSGPRLTHAPSGPPVSRTPLEHAPRARPSGPKTAGNRTPPHMRPQNPCSRAMHRHAIPRPTCERLHVSDERARALRRAARRCACCRARPRSRPRLAHAPPASRAASAVTWVPLQGIDRPPEPFSLLSTSHTRCAHPFHPRGCVSHSPARTPSPGGCVPHSPAPLAPGAASHPPPLPPSPSPPNAQSQSAQA